jgi:MFS transporter, FLVCR family, feline leukemia virus subgroup C receptor-related protein
MEEQTEQFKVYKRRWVVLALYSLYCTVNAVQWLQYSIIADVVVEYYQVSYTAVNWTSIIYMLAYVVTILPGTWFFNKTV